MGGWILWLFAVACTGGTEPGDVIESSTVDTVVMLPDDTAAPATSSGDTGSPEPTPFVGDELRRVTFGADVRAAELVGLSTGELAVLFSESMPSDAQDTTLYLSIFSAAGDLVLPRKVITEENVRAFAIAARPDGTVAVVYAAGQGAWHEVYERSGTRQGLRLVLSDSFVSNLGILGEADRSVIVQHSIVESRFRFLDTSSQVFTNEGVLTWAGNGQAGLPAHVLPLSAGRYLMLGPLEDDFDSIQTVLHGNVLDGTTASSVGASSSVARSFGVPGVARFGSGDTALFFSSVGDFNLYMRRIDGAGVLSSAGLELIEEKKTVRSPRIVATGVSGGDVLVIYRSAAERGQFRRIVDGTFTVGATIEFTDAPVDLLDATTLAQGVTAIAYSVGSTSTNGELLLLE